MPTLLPLVWAGIIAFCIVMYVLLDGVTLGTGMLLSFLNDHERDLAMSVILPTWDGNQTWLVLGAASLYGAFPTAFAALMPVLYIPLLLMVLALLLRGVIFEFRLKSTKEKKHWDTIFILASLYVALTQGLVLGNFIQGFDYSIRPYTMTDRAFFSPFTVFTALSIVVGYLLLGSTRLIIKTENELQDKMYKIAMICALIAIPCMITVSLWTPFINHLIFARWFENQNWIFLAMLPYLTGLFFLVLFWTLYKKEERFPYWCTVGLFLCGYTGFAISLYPYIVPFHITVWQAASPTNTLIFILFGAMVMLPFLLLYTGYSYYIFRGKVKHVTEY